MRQPDKPIADLRAQVALTGEVGAPAAPPTSSAPWHVLWTRSHCEQLVFEQLAAQGFRVFLPTVDTWSRGRDGRRHLRCVSLFPGYLFLNHTLDRWSDVQVRKARGLVAILGDGWDRRSVVPPGEIGSIRRVVDAGEPTFPYVYPALGQRVRIISGPLADVEGVLVRARPNRGLLVLSVELLHRCVAVEIDCTLVVPA